MSEEMRNFNTVALCGLISGVNVAAGLGSLMKHYSALDSVRDAVYLHADKITPEIIEQADRLVSKVGENGVIYAIIHLGFAGFTGAGAYFLARKQKE